MTPREIDAKVAIEVMGWSSVSLPTSPRGTLDDGWDIGRGGGWSAMPKFRWKPSTSTSDAMKVVEKMRERGYSFHAGTDEIKGAWYAAFSEMKTDCLYEEDGESLPMAISLAALKAVGAMEESK